MFVALIVKMFFFHRLTQIIMAMVTYTCIPSHSNTQVFSTQTSSQQFLLSSSRAHVMAAHRPLIKPNRTKYVNKTNNDIGSFRHMQSRPFLTKQTLCCDAVLWCWPMVRRDRNHAVRCRACCHGNTARVGQGSMQSLSGRIARHHWSSLGSSLHLGLRSSSL